MVRVLEYPAALHFDYLEGFLTLSYVRRLCEETETSMPPGPCPRGSIYTTIMDEALKKP